MLAAGLTLVEPVPAPEVKLPGVIATLVAPLVVQRSVLLEPEVMLLGLAVKELMVGLPVATLTVIVAVDVVEPVELLAVSVYVVVAVGLTLIEPFAEAEVNVPGVIAMLVAPFVFQLKTLLAPEVMLVGLAVNELIVGLVDEPTVTVVADVVDPAALVALSV